MNRHNAEQGPLNVLVTGAASGIGRAIAQHLARAGHQVWLSDANLAAAQSACADLLAESHRVIAAKLDVTSEADIADLFADIASRCSGIDLLVNNAGIQHVAPLEEFPPEKWRRLIDILLTGPALTTRAALPGMKARNFGRIVNVGSIHALVASPFKSAYVAAKHGILGFSKVIALETASHDITINTLCPAYVKTPLVEAQIASQAAANGIPEQEVVDNIMLAPMPKKSFISTDELCGALDFLISPAARNMTGQEIVLDGGWVCR